MKKRFTYTNNTVTVKSEIQLAEEQIQEIFNIVNRTLMFAYIEIPYIISRKTYYYIKNNVKSVTCIIKRNKILIKIFKQ